MQSVNCLIIQLKPCTVDHTVVHTFEWMQFQYVMYFKLPQNECTFNFIINYIIWLTWFSIDFNMIKLLLWGPIIWSVYFVWVAFCRFGSQILYIMENRSNPSWPKIKRNPNAKKKHWATRGKVTRGFLSARNPFLVSLLNLLILFCPSTRHGPQNMNGNTDFSIVKILHNYLRKGLKQEVVGLITFERLVLNHQQSYLN